jgi:hypothetical protein
MFKENSSGVRTLKFSERKGRHLTLSEDGYVEKKSHDKLAKAPQMMFSKVW